MAAVGARVACMAMVGRVALAQQALQEAVQLQVLPCLRLQALYQAAAPPRCLPHRSQPVPPVVSRPRARLAPKWLRGWM